ncbi:Gfo/Idh/MocA family protein [Novosphingobium sp. P6W]|uniref:Gfo/Idh/MocA family protein n=1 Tax=Novosphingobium sp. P6W TaxID=1609758 RepID=UPI0005C5B9B3|nr:Gfo/Idh/MocA family oxidoreductase [Novosphingobium sp. P6W]AXB80490.1 gfo/Idh/MocA family oxidoreductase [Novosphingobium sp. P6W]
MDFGVPLEPVRTAVIGAGDISEVYLNTIDRSPALTLCGIASGSMTSAHEKAERYGVEARTLEALLSDTSVELLVNLAPGHAHDEINERIIAADKHLYTEKPFSISVTKAAKLVQEAERRGVMIASAPDTFFGAGHQVARRVLDSGGIGKPVFGISTIGHAGVEQYHPSPASFYRPGGEPPRDIGPYYIAQWVNLLGPVRSVYASSARGAAERTVLRGPTAGTQFPVDICTTYSAVLTFAEATVSLVTSLDMANPAPHQNHCYGSEAALVLPDPNFFGGEPFLLRRGLDPKPVPLDGLPFGAPNRTNHAGLAVADYRGVGLLDLAIAHRRGTKHRTSAAFILHICEVVEAIMASARSGEARAIETQCRRPDAVDFPRDTDLIALMPSPWP